MNKYTKLDEQGKTLPDDAPEWFAKIDNERNLMMIEADACERRLAHADAEKLASESTLLGYKDWRLETVQEQLAIVDYTKFNPAVDRALFPHIKPEPYWTSTRASWARERDAWFVYFGYGGSYYNTRAYEARVRLVRSVAPASASQ